MACNCGGGAGTVRLVTFADGTTTVVDSESEARGEVSAHGGGTWQVLRGAEAKEAVAAHQQHLRNGS